MNQTRKGSRGFHMPHVFIILLFIMLMITALSYMIPSGSYERVEDTLSGMNIIDPDTFRYVENENPITFMNYFEAVYNWICKRCVDYGNTFYLFRGDLLS